MTRILNGVRELMLLVAGMMIAFALWWVMVNGALVIGEWLRNL